MTPSDCLHTVSWGLLPAVNSVLCSTGRSSFPSFDHPTKRLHSLPRPRKALASFQPCGTLHYALLHINTTTHTTCRTRLMYIDQSGTLAHCASTSICNAAPHSSGLTGVLLASGFVCKQADAQEVDSVLCTPRRCTALRLLFGRANSSTISHTQSCVAHKHRRCGGSPHAPRRSLPSHSRSALRSTVATDSGPSACFRRTVVAGASSGTNASRFAATAL